MPARTPRSRSLNLCASFATLRRRWIAAGAAKKEERTNAALARFLTEKLGRRVTAQSCSSWATGSDASHSSPPWDVIGALLTELGLAITFDGAGNARLASS